MLIYDSETCRYRNCLASVASDHRVHCSVHWEALTKSLWRSVVTIGREAKALYVGRSCYPARRLLEHRQEKGLKNLAVLYWASDWNEIDLVEEEIIRRSCEKWDGKLHNISSDSAGRHSGAWNALYVAWSRKRGGKRIPSEHIVGALHHSERLWPFEESSKAPPVVLSTSVSKDQALQLLGARRTADAQKRELISPKMAKRARPRVTAAHKRWP